VNIAEGIGEEVWYLNQCWVSTGFISGYLLVGRSSVRLVSNATDISQDLCNIFLMIIGISIQVVYSKFTMLQAPSTLQSYHLHFPP
jgi:hypothetical protein